MEKFRPLPKSNTSNQSICVMADQNSKVARAVPVSKASSTHMVNIYLDHWITPSGIHNYLLINNGPSFERKFFTLVYGSLRVKHFTTTAYHTQTNGQARRFNRTVVPCLRQYDAGHQPDRDLYAQPLSYAHSPQIYRSRSTFQYSFALSRHLPEPTLWRASSHTTSSLALLSA